MEGTFAGPVVMVCGGCRWPMFTVATYALAPFPVVILGKVRSSCVVRQDRRADERGVCVRVSGEQNEEASQLAYWSYFTTGWIVAVSFGLPCILTHSAVIAVGNCLISMASSFVFYGTIVALAWWQAVQAGDLYGVF